MVVWGIFLRRSRGRNRVTSAGFPKRKPHRSLEWPRNA
jgi:hypothetical protein